MIINLTEHPYFRLVDPSPDAAAALEDLAVGDAVPLLIVEAPSRYMDSLPGKGVRYRAIEALHEWFRVLAGEAAIIGRVVDLPHGASLMLDDVQDSSPLRRGSPSVHMVFGI
ncbi:hypothetical protein MYCTH_2126111 [Thermothelomyces thermophilus ATCC 42464]|uniref:Uncharacterized protein n=1 Tax=Thermothelomyces thermophilus (strain ATCC 42464 / BCRC 31852 / DSM 1799) TaxID=573729 RepID=G2Q8Y4_THET4|nr:uncharacterized protein MYCTH_2126111 [Thermothelomyces thermophilus ATCC 42464]AEO57129.1 hypothetical protein MYCTH_2126111 [Thermothelomyces thermophilus ATCC 42464]